MDYKKSTAPRTTITRNMNEIESKIGNVYEAITIISKRANQIGQETRELLVQKLNEFATSTDNLEEIFENREQIEISKFYEKLPKPSSIATQEWVEDKIYFRKANI